MAELVNPRNGTPGTTGYAWNNTAAVQSPDGTGLKQQALATAESAKESAKHQIESIAQIGKDRVAAQLDTVARVLRSTGDQLEGDAQAEMVARYAQKAGESVERASKYLREHEAIDLVDGVERAARSQPLVFFGSAFVIGLALGRFLKSSAPARSFEPDTSGGFYGYGNPEPEEAVMTSRTTAVGTTPSSFAADEGASFATDPTDPFARPASTYRSGTGDSGNGVD